MKYASPVILLICLFARQMIMANPDPAAERIWTGVNGSSFRGTYSRTLDLGAKIEFLTAAGKVVRVDINNLSKADQEVILSFEKKLRKKTQLPIIEGDIFKELPVADRKLFPELKPEDFGGDDNESLADALWISLLWWDSFDIVPIPKAGSFDRKAGWLHKEITRYVAKGGRSSASLDDAKDGVAEYFSKRLGEIGTCEGTVITEALTPEVLANLATGNDIVILKMTMTYSNGRDFTASTVLESMDKDGTFALHIFGNRFTGKMVPEPGRKAINKKTTSYELVLNDRLDMPEHYLSQGARFYLGDNGWNGALRLKPFIFKDPEEKDAAP